jgi:hypothetical protein
MDEHADTKILIRFLAEHYILLFNLELPALSLKS